ncbi:hypothetical protein CEP53_010006 [Fusarium sp. AF-6]|nr:hypothetical protein CEP53_010006 [Fusarium sp. AF-6]
MVKIAVAGGSDSIGQAIVQAIEKDGSHECFILSRSPKDTEKSKIITVDYADIESLRDTLEAYDIDTVISAITLQSDAGGQSQMNLIEAANQSRCTQRFMPSEFGVMYKPEHLEALPLYAWKFRAVERLAETNLEYTQFSNGMFMDYWFAPRIPSAFKFNVPSWIDLDHSYAAIPGDGNTPMVFMHSRDIGRFVVKVLSLPSWDKRYFLVGDRLTLNEFLRLAEEAKGVSFERHSDSLATLIEGKCTMMPSVKSAGFGSSLFINAVAAAGVRTTQGDLDLPMDKTLNSMFPDLQTLRIQDAVRVYFTDKS